MGKILVIDDDSTLAAEIRRALSAADYMVDTALSADEARSYLAAAAYDLLVLDWELPDISGPDICRQIRASNMANIPIIFLTARISITDKETGFANGADDYLTKPFDMRELLMRIKALLNRPGQMQSRMLRARNIRLDIDKHEVYRDEEKIDLFPKEFAVLQFLMSHPNEIFSPDTLVKRVWSTDSDASLETLRVTVMRIRQKVLLAEDKPLIVTLRNIGYRLEL